MKKVGLIALVGFMFIGCGGGSSGNSTRASLPVVDNSKLTTTSADFGYFGGDVQYAGYKAAGIWSMYNQDNTADDLDLYILSDGRIRIHNTRTGKSIRTDGAVSKDGLTVNFRNSTVKPGTITVKSLSRTTTTSTHNGVSTVYKCYNVTLETFGISSTKYTLCPFR